MWQARRSTGAGPGLLWGPICTPNRMQSLTFCVRGSTLRTPPAPEGRREAGPDPSRGVRQALRGRSFRVPARDAASGARGAAHRACNGQPRSGPDRPRRVPLLVSRLLAIAHLTVCKGSPFSVTGTIADQATSLTVIIGAHTHMKHSLTVRRTAGSHTLSGPHRPTGRTHGTRAPT